MDQFAEALFYPLRLQVAFLEQYAHSCATAVIMMRNTVDSMLPDPLLLMSDAIARRDPLGEA